MTTSLSDSTSVTLKEAKSLIKSLAHEQSLLLLSPPGVGKSDIVQAAAQEAGLPCRSLLGTQIAPEDVSGVPHIVGERSVFCPPRVLLPEKPEPFCLFLDELPACAPDIQKAFYSLLLERRLGEHALPKGTWVVSAGNRLQDKALVRSLSSALVNRVFILKVRVDVGEWLVWAGNHGVRPEILSYVSVMPQALLREPNNDAHPFSTPRAWASLSRALDLAAHSGLDTHIVRSALAFGRISPEDAAIFCAVQNGDLANIRPAKDYLCDPDLLPTEDTARWFALNVVREAVVRQEVDQIPADVISKFLLALSHELRFAILIDCVDAWGRLGADEAMLQSMCEVTGISLGNTNILNPLPTAAQ